MLTPKVLLQSQKYNFNLLARQEPSGRRRLRYMALAHIKEAKSASETALALPVTPRAVTQWLKWFVDEGLDRVAEIPHYWSSQRLPKAQEEAFRQAVEQLQDRRGGGRVCGEDIRQLLAEQFDVAYRGGSGNSDSYCRVTGKAWCRSIISLRSAIPLW